MNHTLSRTVARFTFYAVALIIFGWTASLTYSFVQAALPATAWYVPLLSLVVFDAGLIAWLFVFLNFAEGAGQRAVALLATTFDLIGVSLMVIAEVLLGGQELVAAPEMLGTLAVWGIGIWTIGNVLAVVLFHLLSPEARKSMALQSEKDAVFDAALHQLKGKREAASGYLADGISDNMLRELITGLFADENSDGIPDVFQLPQHRVMSNDNQNSRSKQESANESRGNSQGPFRGL